MDFKSNALDLSLENITRIPEELVGDSYSEGYNAIYDGNGAVLNDVSFSYIELYPAQNFIFNRPFTMEFYFTTDNLVSLDEPLLQISDTTRKVTSDGSMSNFIIRNSGNEVELFNRYI